MNLPETAGAIARAVISGRIPPDAALERSRARIAARNPGLNALVDYDPADAEADLAALRARLAAGDRPPLAGVPVAVKDHIAVAGWRMTEGSLIFRDRRAAEDDAVVTRLRRAGAILVGRSNMSEFGCKGATDNRLYGATRNPVNPALTPGGSSGGAAAAVAAGLVPLALASDGGGSVRRPAAHVGAVGWKPSTGAIADPRAFTHTAVFGVIARRVEDAALAFRVLAGADPRDPVTVPLPRRGSRTAGLGIAWSPRLGLEAAVDDEIAAGLEAAVGRLARSGLDIRRADPAWPPGASEEGLMPLQYGALALAFGGIWRDHPERFDPDIGRQIEAGLGLSAVAMAQAETLSRAIARAAAAFFAEGFDLLLAPTVPCPPWPLGQLDPDTIGGRPAAARAHAVFTPFLNHAFCPALSLPAGYTRAGLPYALQVIGPRLSDHRTLAAAAVIERLLGTEA